ncbi:HlyD family secretion protein [Dyadobacter crusticola]|uniref:HlyD family secretion protein n=1 Tax=Dyadobacter crusticola TaxID=292407 RepID=UPI0004E18CB8|nr:HlyD family efflux transporter periplasmic adaptor subunit [Dyadobacter crusticola]
MHKTEYHKDLPGFFSEIRSDEVYEIISSPPNWLVRWGITLFFLFFVILISACWIIKYPDIVTAPFSLTASDPPRGVIVRSDGKLKKLLVVDGDEVRAGQLLAYCETTADPIQVLKLGKAVHEFNRSISKGRWEVVKNWNGAEYTMLGEVQRDFQIFSQKLNELGTFLENGFYQQKRVLLLEELEDLGYLEKNLSEQVSLQQREYELAEQEFGIQETLYKKKVIPILEYKREEAKALAKQIPLKNLASAMIQNQSSQTAKRKEIMELDNAVFQQKNDFSQILQSLESSIYDWKQKFVLTTPVAGKVSFSAPWSEGQFLVTGQEFLTVEPKTETVQGLVRIPQNNLGKIREGQRVIVKLDGYPYREYGVLEGHLSKISLVPRADSLYWGYVSLPYQLKTSYNQDLLYRNGMKGSAEIVTSDKRMSERIISVLYIGR